MFFTVTTSRLLTLLYLCVSMLTASGSPLPPPDRVKPFGPEVSAGFRPESKVQLGQHKKEKKPTHAMLAIDDRMFHALSESGRSEIVLRPQEIPVHRLEYYKTRYNWITLGTVQFKSSAQQELAFEALLSIKLAPWEITGEDCWDYVGSALKTLNKYNIRLDSASISSKFEEKEKQFRDS
ncbi:hypothetical protein F5890DRAFT_807226 [Lentinula detonsa]|uniref:Uncharacterized protein n=1 Tax=Lentinula detonsa TaxID=2804962 RepID=A0AA38UMX7_9AGAR|nr:hypothetical protein F5890DRAFT_807226 [Lentinula detonsa]